MQTAIHTALNWMHTGQWWLCLFCIVSMVKVLVSMESQPILHTFPGNFKVFYVKNSWVTTWSNQEMRSPDFTFASKQRCSEEVLKSSLCQLCKIYVISASKLLQFAGFYLVCFWSCKLHSSWHTGSLLSVLCWATMHRLERERLRLVPVYSGAIPCID